MPISFILSLFLYQLSIGCMMSLALMPLRQVDIKFYQLSSGLGTLLAAIALGFSWYYPFALSESFVEASSRSGSWAQANLILCVLYLAVTFFLYVRMRRKEEAGAKILVRLSAGLGLLALVAQGLVLEPRVFAGSAYAWLVPINLASAALFLGIYMLAMVFGHWYLVKSMPKRLLRRMAEIVIVVLVVRIILVALVWTLYALKVPGGAQQVLDWMDFGLGGHGIFFWQRVLIGLIVPLILSFMIWSTAKLGANQSATGLLYVGVVFVIIGELVGIYIFLRSGIPI